MRIVVLLGVLTTLTGAVACAPPPGEIQPALPVGSEWVLRAPRFGTAWRQQFGPYVVHRVGFSNVRQRGSLLDVTVRGKEQLQQRYEFRLADRGTMQDLWVVRCDHGEYERGYRIGSVEVTLDQATTLECTLHPPGDPSHPWSLRLSAPDDSVPRGLIRRGDTQYRVEGERPNALDRVSGYSITTGDRVVVDVGRLGRRSMRLVSDSDDEDLLAAAAAALLMQPKLTDP